jgi:hypothetical protein
MAGEQLRATRVDFSKERAEDVSRAVRVGEQLAVRLFVERDAQLAEERDRLVDRERTQHPPDDGPRSAPEVPFRDRNVGHVAARSAADQDLGAGLTGAFEDDDVPRRIGPPREDGSRQPGGAGADDRDIAGRREAQPANKVLCRLRLGRDDRRMRAAGVAANDQRFAVLEAADDLGAVTAALPAQLRRLRLGLRMSVVNHDVVLGRNVVAKLEQHHPRL